MVNRKPIKETSIDIYDTSNQDEMNSLKIESMLGSRLNSPGVMFCVCNGFKIVSKPCMRKF